MTTKTNRPLRTFGSAFALISGLLISLPAGAADIQIEINQSLVHRLSRAASTIIVGNPAIADVSVNNTNTLVVFGRTYGKTNLIALDASGQQIANLDLNVVASRGTALTVNRGTGKLSYNCTPQCVRVIDPTDDNDASAALLTNTQGVTGFNTQAAKEAGER